MISVNKARSSDLINHGVWQWSTQQEGLLLFSFEDFAPSCIRFHSGSTLSLLISSSFTPIPSSVLSQAFISPFPLSASPPYHQHCPSGASPTVPGIKSLLLQEIITVTSATKGCQFLCWITEFLIKPSPILKR